MAGVKSRTPSIATVEARIEAGFGQGQSSNYKPLMYFTDVPSEGTSTMVQSRVIAGQALARARLAVFDAIGEGLRGAEFLVKSNLSSPQDWFGNPGKSQV
ncbi:hypothetical protein [Pseudomonas huanghezhanensis]|uniref:hypothetical protein n=1 Tax=Pseudomonas huanghezhanensis TaxID=3002903 RepID=UPI00228553E0|nr:hypothetical protein [Pseudomonas sp. BSw22131]